MSYWSVFEYLSDFRKKYFHKYFVISPLKAPNSVRLLFEQYTATCLPSRKLSKLDEREMQDTTGETETSSLSDILLWTPTYGRAKAGWPARTYIQQLCEDTNVTLNTCQKWWTIGRSGGRGSGISMLAARHDDDDDWTFFFLKTKYHLH